MAWTLCAAVALSPFACKDKPPPEAPPEPPTSVAEVLQISGPVELERQGRLSPAAAGPLYANDALSTGEEASAKVRFANGRSVEVGPNTRFSVGEDQSGLLLTIQKGFLLALRPSEGDGSPEKKLLLTILSPFGFTRLEDESEVAVSAGAGADKVEVRFGKARFIGLDGREVNAEAGQAVDADSAGARVPPKVLPIEPMNALVVVFGKAQILGANEKSFRPLVKSSPLSKGDTVRVLRGSARVKFNPSRAEVLASSDSQLSVLRSERQGGADLLDVDLKTGEIQAMADPNAPMRLSVSGVELSGPAGGTLAARKRGNGFEIDALASDWTLRQADKDSPLTAGQRVRVEKGGALSVEPIPRAGIVLPLENGLTVYHPAVPAMAFVWAGEAGEYQVQMAQDAEFATLLLRGTVREPFMNFRPPPSGSVFVKVKRAGSEEELSGSASFAPEPTRTELGELRNEVPEGSQKTTIYYQDKPPGVKFTYIVEPAAAHYRLRVFSAADKQSPVTEKRSETSFVEVEPGVLKEGSYVWSVTPLAANGDALRVGRINHLELVYDNSVQNLVISSPRNGEALSTGRVRAKGIAPLGSAVYINGASASLDSKHRFETLVSPVGSPPAVVFRLKKGARETYTVRVMKPGRRR